MQILVVDDHVLFRCGLIFLLQDLAPDLSVREAGDCATATAPGSDGHDLILLDLHLPGTAGLDALDCIRERFVDCRVVVLSGEEDPRQVRMAIERGAAGFIPKSSTPEVMIGALRLVLAGGVYLPAIALSDLASPAGPASPYGLPGTGECAAASPATRRVADGRIDGAAALSERQLDVLHRAILGKSNKAIARDLRVAEGTVKAHLSTAFRLLGVHNRTEAVYRAAQLGLRWPDATR